MADTTLFPTLLMTFLIISSFVVGGSLRLNYKEMIAPTLVNPDSIFARVDDFTAFSLSKKARFKLLCTLVSSIWTTVLKYVSEVNFMFDLSGHLITFWLLFVVCLQFVFNLPF